VLGATLQLLSSGPSGGYIYIFSSKLQTRLYSSARSPTRPGGSGSIMHQGLRARALTRLRLIASDRRELRAGSEPEAENLKVHPAIDCSEKKCSVQS